MADRLPHAFVRRSWWWMFLVLVAAPAVALALLGLGAIRADDRERQRAHAERQAQVADQIARLTDAALATVFDQLTTVGQADTDAVAGATVTRPLAFELDAEGVVTFPVLRLAVPPVGAVPVVRDRLSPDTRDLVERAMAAELRGEPVAASALYDALRAHDDVAAWADWRRRRQSVASTDELVDYLNGPAAWTAGALTPSGIPVAIAAVVELGSEPGVTAAPLGALAARAIEAIDDGRWWLTLSQRRTYVATLSDLLPGDEDDVTPAGDPMTDLSVVAEAVRTAVAQRGHLFSRATVVGDDARSHVVVWPSSGGPEATRGVVVAGSLAREAVGAALGPLLDHEPFRAVLRSSTGTFWDGGQAGDAIDAGEPHTLASMPGWTLSLIDTSPPVAPEHGLLRYARVVLPIVVLGFGVVITAWVVRRELALARMQSSFVAAVTHEFKSPITSIRLLMERLASGRIRPGESAERYHVAIGLEADRLENLVNRLLESQKLQTGQRQYDFRPSSLRTILASAIEHLRPQAESKNITVTLHAPAHEPPDVIVDPDALADAVRNLIDNAIKYSPEETTVVVELAAGDEAAVITVSDEGIGVDPRERDRLFEPFYRSRRGDQANVHGTGLGLALVRATAEAHGGTVHVDADGGRGSRFVLSLPIKSDGRKAAGQTWRATPSGAAEAGGAEAPPLQDAHRRRA